MKLLFFPQLRIALKNRFTFEQSRKKFSTSIETERKQKVIYTCITGEYENLLYPSYYNREYDYICFTDTAKLLELKQYGPWQIRPLLKDFGNPILNNRWHKMMPHIVLSDYNDSIYIDGNLDILDDFVFFELANRDSADILIPLHYSKKCVYKEIKAFEKVYIKKPEFLEKLFLLKNKYIQEMMPKNYGLNENNFIYRKHNDLVASLMDEWWELLKSYVPRDQLYLSYILWKHNIKPSEIALPNCRCNIEHFHFYYTEKHC